MHEEIQRKMRVAPFHFRDRSSRSYQEGVGLLKSVVRVSIHLNGRFSIQLNSWIAFTEFAKYE